MNKKILLLFTLITSITQISKSSDITASFKIKTALKLATMLQPETPTEFPRLVSRSEWANVIPGQKRLLESAERTVEATNRTIRKKASETHQRIKKLATDTQTGLSAAWQTIKLAPEAIAEYFKPITRETEIHEHEATTGTENPQPKKTTTNILKALQQPRNTARKARTILATAKKKIEEIEQTLEEAHEKANKEADEIIAEGEKTVAKIKQLVTEEISKIKKAQSEKIIAVKRHHIIHPRLPKAKPAKTVPYMLIPGSLTEYMKVEKALEAELLPMDDKPFSEGIIPDPDTVSINKIIQNIQYQTALQIKEIEQRALIEEAKIKEQAYIMATKLHFESIHKDSQKFIALMEQFYDLLIQDIKKEIRSGKAFLQIKSELDTEAVQAELRVTLTHAAQLWLQFDATFSPLPVTVNINKTKRSRAPMQWARFTAEAGFKGVQVNELFNTMYHEHTKFKFEHIQKLIEGLDHKVEEFIGQEEDDEEAFNQLKSIRLAGFKQYLINIYKILLAQTIKTTGFTKTTQYFAIKSEFKMLFPEGIGNESLRETLQTLAAIWEILMHHEIITRTELVTLYHPLSTDKKPLSLTGEQWRDFTANAKFDPKDADDSEFASALKHIDIEKKSSDTTSEWLTELARNVLRKPVAEDDDL